MLLPHSLLLLLCAVVSVWGQSTSSGSSSAPSSARLSSALSSVSSSANASTSGSVSATSSVTSSAFPSLSTFSPCVNNCLGIAIGQVGCDSFTDVNCYCATSNATAFALALVKCIGPQCPGDLGSAEDVSQQFCNVASSSVSLSFPTTNASSSSVPTSSSHSSTSIADVTSSFSSSITSSSLSSTGTSSSATPSQTGADQANSGTTIKTMPGLITVLTGAACLSLFGILAY